MTLDLNAVRADFACFLSSHASKRHSLDAALMHVVEAAYQKGLADALFVPAVLRDAFPNLDTGLAAGNGSAAGVELAAVAPAGISQDADGTGQGGSIEGGNAAPACEAKDLNEKPKGGPLARLAGMWCADPRFQSWLAHAHAAEWHALNLGYPAAETAAAAVRMICGITSRADLDNNPQAARVFNARIRAPYSTLLKSKP
jgi:hypothetical protein